MFTRLEWFRQPFSKLEKTLRLPLLFKQVLFLFLKRVIFIWILFYLLILLISRFHLLSVVVGFFIAVVFELFALRGRYNRFVLPKHQKNIESVKENARNLSQYSNKELLMFIKKATQKSAWSMINIGYLILPSWGWEIIFKAFYPLLVKKTTIRYQDLLIGFSNKTTEANIALWYVAQENDLSKKNSKLNKYLDNYGSRVDDIDLRNKTFRERTKAINGLLKLYEKIKSPVYTLQQAEKRRIEAEKNVILNLRVPKWFFKKILNITQKNVALREDRRFYEFEFDYYIRMALLLLADKLYKPNDDIFNKSWNNIKYESYKRNSSK